MGGWISNRSAGTIDVVGPEGQFNTYAFDGRIKPSDVRLLNDEIEARMKIPARQQILYEPISQGRWWWPWEEPRNEYVHLANDFRQLSEFFGKTLVLRTV